MGGLLYSADSESATDAQPEAAVQRREGLRRTTGAACIRYEAMGRVVGVRVRIDS